MALTNANTRGNYTNHRLDGLSVHGDLLLTGDQGVSVALGVDANSNLLINGTSATPTNQTLRNTIRLAALGLSGETYDLASAAAASIQISGSIYYLGIPLVAGEVVTNLHVALQAVGSGAGICRVGICDKNGVQKAQSADLNSTMTGSVGVKQCPLSAAFTAPATDLYYAQVFSICGTTQPTLMRGSIASTMPTLYTAISGSSYGRIGVQTGQTDILANGTITYNSGSCISYWIGWN